MPALNTLLFALGLFLQIALITLLLRRHLASKLRLFFTLLLFYCLRSAFLVALLPHLAHPVYSALSTALSAVDLLLQIALAVAISIEVLTAHRSPFDGGPLLPRALLVPGLFLLAPLLTAAVDSVLPPYSPAPVDRGILATALLFLELALWTRLRPISLLSQTVLNGLASYSAFAIVSQVGKCLSAIHRSRPAYAASSYIGTVAYLAILMFWIVAFWIFPYRPAHSRHTVAESNP